jgi:hypothetical protein
MFESLLHSQGMAMYGSFSFMSSTKYNHHIVDAGESNKKPLHFARTLCEFNEQVLKLYH